MVPAWKRLGLKLKFAKDEPDSPGEFEATRNGHLNDDDSKVQQPAKRRRIGNSTIKLDPHEFQNLAESPTQPRRKKSVSFTEDTKTEDGDSRVTIDFPVNSAGFTPKKPMSETQQPNFEQETMEQSNSGSTESVSTQGKKKKSKALLDTTSKSSARKSKDSLDYLNQHHMERTMWKYNKNRDIWVIKHALSTDEIPITYNRALAGYVHGLPPKAGARLRLVEQCRINLPEITPTATNDHYESLFRNDLNNTTTNEREAGYTQWLSQIPRPTLLMLALGVDGTLANGQVTDANKKSLSPFVKKKKARTRANVEISSSSESESDSSSESSDSSSDSDSAHETKPSEDLTDGDSGSDSTSSSGSSTSNSDSD